MVGLARQVRPQRGGARGLPGGDDLPPRRLRRVRRAARGRSRTARPSCPAPARPAGGPQAAASLETLRPGDVIQVPAGRRGGLAVVLDPGTAGGARRAAAHGADRGAAGAPALAGRLPGAGRGAAPAADPEDVQPAQPGAAGGTWPPRCAAPAWTRPAGDGPRRAAVGGRRRRRAAATCAPSCARTRATAATSARTTPAGPSGTTGCAGRPTALSRRVREPHAHHRAHLRPDLRPARGARLPARRRGDDRPGAALGALYTELDLVTAECLREGVWARADAGRARVGRVGAGLRVAPGRRRQRRRSCRPAATREVLAETERRWRRWRSASASHRLTPARRARPAASPGRPTAGPRARRWTPCCGTPTWRAGDFVRWTKQVVDLLGQLADAGRQQPGAEPVGRGSAQGGRPAASRRGRLLLGGLTVGRRSTVGPCWRPPPRPLPCRS